MTTLKTFSSQHIAIAKEQKTIWEDSTVGLAQGHQNLTAPVIPNHHLPDFGRPNATCFKRIWLTVVVSTVLKWKWNPTLSEADHHTLQPHGGKCICPCPQLQAAPSFVPHCTLRLRNLSAQACLSFPVVKICAAAPLAPL